MSIHKEELKLVPEDLNIAVVEEEVYVPVVEDNIRMRLEYFFKDGFHSLEHSSIQLNQSGKSLPEKKLLYDGTKIFWKIKLLLDIFIFRHKEENCIEVFTAHGLTGVESNHLYLDVNQMRSSLQLNDVETFLEGVKANKIKNNKSFRVLKETEEYMKQYLINFVLTRLEATLLKSDKIEIYFKPTIKDPVFPDTQTLVAIISKPENLLPSSIPCRRISSMEDMKVALRELRQSFLREESNSSTTITEGNPLQSSNDPPVQGTTRASLALRRSMDDSHVLENTIPFDPSTKQIHQTIKDIQDNFDQESSEITPTPAAITASTTPSPKLSDCAAISTSSSSLSPTTSTTSGLQELDKFLKKSHSNHLPGLKLTSNTLTRQSSLNSGKFQQDLHAPPPQLSSSASNPKLVRQRTNPTLSPLKENISNPIEKLSDSLQKQLSTPSLVFTRGNSNKNLL